MSKVERNKDGKFKGGTTTPAYDPVQAAIAVREEYFDVDIDEEKLLAIAEKGQDELEAFRNGLKYATISIAAKGIPKESANPMVILRNKSDEDCLIKSARYGSDYDDVCPVKTKDGKKVMGKVARRKGEFVRDDPLAKEGLTNLSLKAGTYYKCRVSLARLIKEKSGMGDNLVIEKYEPKIHDKRVGKAVVLADDPSVSAVAAGKQAKGSARFVSAEEFGGGVHSSVDGDPEDGKAFNIPDGDFEKEFNRFGEGQPAE